MSDYERVRLYDQVRTAHLERAAQLPAATILYGERRYDFDAALIRDLDLIRVRGWRAARFMLRHRVRVLEVNEPLMLSGVRSTAMALLGVTLKDRLGGPRTTLVTYAIENLDPRALPRPSRLRHQLARHLDLFLSRWIWRRVDRIVYGTAAAQETYRQALPHTPHTPQSVVIPALPAPAADADPATKHRNHVLFVGALVPRKGFALLLHAWPEVRRLDADAVLTIVGKGALQEMAEESARSDPTVELRIDPPRVAIRELLRTSQVLVLPSQRTPAWREQVGLPIVEGLSYGCTIVTTSETGLAPWLATEGHRVVPADADETVLAQAISEALQHPVAAGTVLASLPLQDGRLAADAWLFDPTVTDS